jgi:hypothetical protein
MLSQLELVFGETQVELLEHYFTHGNQSFSLPSRLVFEKITILTRSVITRINDIISVLENGVGWYLFRPFNTFNFAAYYSTMERQKIIGECRLFSTQNTSVEVKIVPLSLLNFGPVRGSKALLNTLTNPDPLSLVFIILPIDNIPVRYEKKLQLTMESFQLGHLLPVMYRHDYRSYSKIASFGMEELMTMFQKCQFSETEAQLFMYAMSSKPKKNYENGFEKKLASIGLKYLYETLCDGHAVPAPVRAHWQWSTCPSPRAR